MIEIGTNKELKNVLELLFDVSVFPAKSYLEIGVKDGGSLEVVLKYAKDLKLLGICDTWEKKYGGSGKGNHNHIQVLLNKCNYKGEVIWLDGKSQDLLPKLKRKFDVILIDGDHSKEGAILDLENSWNLLIGGGYLIFHDIIHSSHSYLEEIWDEFAKGRGIKLKIGNGLGIINKEYGDLHKAGHKMG